MQPALGKAPQKAALTNHFPAIERKVRNQKEVLQIPEDGASEAL
jgi:hypothetical protein